MSTDEALMLFRRLGVDVPSLSKREFADAFTRLARRYHPDSGEQRSHELMAHLNAARTVILKAGAFEKIRQGMGLDR